jgi:hypothetical protein
LVAWHGPPPHTNDGVLRVKLPTGAEIILLFFIELKNGSTTDNCVAPHTLAALCRPFVDIFLFIADYLEDPAVTEA